jgi:purine-binding chemotaxis protein CheW
MAMNPANATVQPTAFAADGGEARQYLIFTLNGESFAIDILQIREIIEFGHLTEVPMMPSMVRGVINLRGAVVPVIDLSARFGRGQTQAARRTCIVILEIADGDSDELQTVGMIVDSVTEVLEIQSGMIEPPPSFGARVRADFIQGMGRIGERFVIILDTGRVLSLEEMALLADITGTVGEAPTVQ